MNIVLDTNVLVSGLLSPFGSSGEIVRMVSSGKLILSFDARIFSEYTEVLLRPKFKCDKEKVIALMDYIKNNGQTVASLPLPQSLPDPDDEPFLEVALAGKAVCPVTGNLGHFPTPLRQGMKILSPGEFLTFYKKTRKSV
jgi:putative PIN family toxin of toxin-antitoxin system